jgi:hypothetical protein
MLASATYFTAKALIGPVAGHDAPPAAGMHPAPADDHQTRTGIRARPSTWRRIWAAVTRSRAVSRTTLTGATGD